MAVSQAGGQAWSTYQSADASLLVGMDIELLPGWFQIIPGVDIDRGWTRTGDKEQSLGPAQWAANEMVRCMNAWLWAQAVMTGSGMAQMAATPVTVDGLANSVANVAKHFRALGGAGIVGFVMLDPAWPDRVVASLAMGPCYQVDAKGRTKRIVAGVKRRCESIWPISVDTAAGSLVGAHGVFSTGDHLVRACLFPLDCKDGVEIEFCVSGLASFPDVPAALVRILDNVTLRFAPDTQPPEPPILYGRRSHLEPAP